MEISLLWGSYLLLGLFSGVLAGLLGVGGGLVIVPALSLLFTQQGFAPDALGMAILDKSLTWILYLA